MTAPVPAIWQVSAGPASRSYADVLLRHGVALIGTGDAGPWAADRGDEMFDGPFVRRFATELGVGDIVLLRTGLARIAAVGIVAGKYEYQNAFDDVNGWDLQHTRRVRWGKLSAEHTFPTAVFGANPPRCARAWSPEVADFATRFLNSPPASWQTASLPQLPVEDPPLSVVPQVVSSLVAQVADLVPLMQDASAFGDLPSEDELIVHYVVPLLRSLGWPPERIAVKWRHVDVALFRALPRTPENCHLVIEAKRLGAGVEGALEQAQGYVTALGLACDVVVTDGIRYRMYSCDRAVAPLAYANLARLKAPAADMFSRLQRI
ncbi:MAG: hypothetical protein U9Q74_05650 [Gemmatimonadota bacterium]|nr:hypothetical protein [Gemmatimonadota bacterium]